MLSDLLPYVVAVAVATYLVVQAVGRHRRRVDLKARAAAREWTFLDRDRSLVDAYPGWPFDQGSGRRARNVVRGRYDGRAMVAFDHSYDAREDIGDRTTTRTREHAIVAVSLAGGHPSLLAASVSTRQQRLPGFFGHDPEVGDPAFDAAFQLDGEADALAVLVPAVRSAMLRRPDLTWRLAGDALLTIRPGVHGADEIEPVLDAMSAVAAALPARR